MMAWGSVGVSLPHSSRQQFSRGQPVAKSDLQQGDLVFFYSDISHVGHLRRQWASHPRTSAGQVGGVHQDVLHALCRSPPSGLSRELFPAPAALARLQLCAPVSFRAGKSSPD